MNYKFYKLYNLPNITVRITTRMHNLTAREVSISIVRICSNANFNNCA